MIQTFRKVGLDALRKSEEELRQILGLAPQLVGVYGSNRQRFHVNRFALDYLGLSFEEWQTAERDGSKPPEPLNPPLFTRSTAFLLSLNLSNLFVFNQLRVAESLPKRFRVTWTRRDRSTRPQ
jgi:PAS domain-containing protein